MEQGDALIKENARVYVIDDAELARVRNSYPCIWKDPDAAPQLCFIGCPHLSLNQILDWMERIDDLLVKHGRRAVAVPTVFTSAPDVIEAFRSRYPEKAGRLKEMKIVLSSMCPLGFTGNPLCTGTRVITASNKFRYYSPARFYTEDELLDIITGGESK